MSKTKTFDNADKFSVNLDMKTQRARDAVGTFRKMQNGLTSYARAVTGDRKVRVVMSHAGGARTDGERIYITPPLALGDKRPHERSLCDRRDPDTLLMLCDACAIREEVLVNIYHEIGHIAFDSFDPTTEADRQAAIETAARERGVTYAEALEKFKRMGRYSDDYQSMVGMISPYLPSILNTFEDARIDSAMFRARPGVRTMLTASTLDILRSARTNEGLSYEDLPLNTQMMLACYCTAARMDGWQPYLDDQIVDDVANPELSELLGRLADSPNQSAVYRLMLPIFDVLRGLGYFLPEHNEKQESQDDDDQADDSADADGDGGSSDQANDDARSGQGQGGQSDGSPAEGRPDNADQSPSADSEPTQAQGGDPWEGGGRPDTGGAGEAGGEASAADRYGDADEVAQAPTLHISVGGDESEHGHENPFVAAFDGSQPNDPEAAEQAETMFMAISQMQHFDTPSVNVAGVRLHREGNPGLDPTTGRACHFAWTVLAVEPELTDTPESIIGPALLTTRRVFSDNQRASHERNLKSGKVNARALGKRAWNNDPRLFHKKRTPGKKSYSVVLGLDISGSTRGEPLERIKRAAQAQAELCHRVGIEFSVYGHTSRLLTSTGQHMLDMYEIKSADEPWDKQRIARLARIGSDSSTLDGHNMEFFRKRLDESAATDKICLYYTDGHMPSANRHEEEMVLRREIQQFAARGYVLLGVGIGTDSPLQYGLDTVTVYEEADVVKVVQHLEKRLAKSGR